MSWQRVGYFSVGLLRLPHSNVAGLSTWAGFPQQEFQGQEVEAVSLIKQGLEIDATPHPYWMKPPELPIMGTGKQGLWVLRVGLGVLRNLWPPLISQGILKSQRVCF